MQRMRYFSDQCLAGVGAGAGAAEGPRAAVLSPGNIPYRAIYKHRRTNIQMSVFQCTHTHTHDIRTLRVFHQQQRSFKEQQTYVCTGGSDSIQNHKLLLQFFHKTKSQGFHCGIP